MMLTGRRASARELAAHGVVNAVVRPEDLDAETERWVADVLSCAPLSVKAIKAVARRTAHLPIHEAYARHSDELLAALSSEDAIEGVAAFRKSETRSGAEGRK